MAGWQKLLTNHNWLAAVELGQVPGLSLVHVQGVRENLADNTPATVWGGAEPLYPFIAAVPFDLEVVSSSALDLDGLNLGLEKLNIHGLDVNYNEQIVEVALTGTTPVEVQAIWSRVNKLESTDCGVLHFNIGKITCTTLASGAEQGIIVSARGLSADGVYTVPSGKKALLLNTTEDLSVVDAGEEAQVAIYTRDRIDEVPSGTWTERSRGSVIGGGTSTQQQLFLGPKIFDEKTDIQFLVPGNVGAGTTVTISALFLLVPAW